MIFKNRFIKPNYDFETKGFWVDGVRYTTYAEYNYLSSNPIVSKIKKIHFEKVLDLTRNNFNKSNVIDFGCADGCFLPSLSNYFPKVVGVDISQDYIETSKKLIKKMDLKNCKCICNEYMDIGELNSRINGSFDILFLLEVLEHVGDEKRIYKSKMEFLNEISSLIHDEGLIIISVPNMVGISFLVQRMGLSFLGLHKDELTWKELFNAGFLYKTDELEKRWNFETHVGFNHKKLERHIQKEFQIVEKDNIFFQTVYSIKKNK